MWGSYPASLQNVDGSTHVPVRAWNNARKGIQGLPARNVCGSTEVSVNAWNNVRKGTCQVFLPQ
jgi:hypothetical protein